MGCVLRVAGVSFDPDRFLRDSNLVAYKVWRRGEPKLSIDQANAFHRNSGMNITVSNADLGEFDQQVKNAIGFLRDHESELTRLVGFPGVDAVGLDFGTAWGDDSAMQTRHLPLELIRLVAQVGLDMEISIYAVSAH